MIHKSATFVGTVVFANGNRTGLWLSANSNTGDRIVWQRTNGGRARRITGRRLDLLRAELREIVTGREATIEVASQAAFAAIS